MEMPLPTHIVFRIDLFFRGIKNIIIFVRNRV